MRAMRAAASGDKGAAFSIAALSQVALRGRTEPVDIFCIPLEHRSASLDLESIALAERERRRLGNTVPHELNIAGQVSRCLLA